jgi:hypothetical protein
MAPPQQDECPTLTSDSPLRALEAGETELLGCPSDVHVRPGHHAKYEIAFPCSEWPEPAVYVRGFGRSPFPQINRAEFRQRADQVMIQILGANFRGWAYYRSVPNPPVLACATHEMGMATATDDYRDVDKIVAGLVSWIVHDDFDAEVILYIHERLIAAER